MSAVYSSQSQVGPSVGRRLVFKLTRDLNGELTVLACEVLGTSFTNRTLFHTINKPKDVLTEELAQHICEIVSTIGTGHQVVSRPEYVIEKSGLTLSVLHVIAAEMRDGVQHLIVRFKTFIGSLGHILAPKIGFEPSLANTQERVALDVLSEIAMPIMDLCTYSMLSSEQQDPQMAKVHANLQEKARDLAINIELLKRFAVGSPAHESKDDGAFSLEHLDAKARV
jgi:hypothetical protein